MLVGIPKEIKSQEHRVGMTPAGVRELRAAGHRVLVQAGAGRAAGFDDPLYELAGAELIGDAGELFARAELVVKVKEPQPEEYRGLREGQILFAFLHLAAEPEQARGLLASGVTAIAYETVTGPNGGLPLLAPMSEVAGRMSVHQAAVCLEKTSGGSGILMSGVPGVEPATVVVLGGGVVGGNAARLAMGLGARVVVLDRALSRLRYLDDLYGGRLTTAFSTAEGLERLLPQADVVIGAVLVPGAVAPRLVSRQMLALMKPGSVLVDVAIDQGGCFATSHPTTHQHPTYVVDGVVHYSVANMPAAVSRTATLALEHATLPYVLKLANRGWPAALAAEPGLIDGVNVHAGAITCPAVAEALGHPCRAIDEPGVATRPSDRG